MPDLGALIAGAIPFIIPGILVASWLVNHKTPTDSKSDSSKSEPKPEAKEEKPSDKDMTSS